MRHSLHAASAVILAIAGGLSACAGPFASSPAAQTDDTHADARAVMVRDQIQARGVSDPRVLDVMRRVPRHLFVRPQDIPFAHADHPLPIDHGQTISQPFIVAWMTEALRLTAKSRVLEIGTGSGYQAAVLAELAAEVYTIEIVAPLAEHAEAVLHSRGYRNVHVRTGDGYAGWPEQAPFDGIIVTAAPDHVPQPLIEQLRPGGHLVLPVGRDLQEMIVVTKSTSGQVQMESVMPVRFVPLIRR